MPSTDTSPPSAFPTLPEHYGYAPGTQPYGTPAGPGMTIREYYACALLAALLARKDKTALKPDEYTRAMAFAAVFSADALIAELAK